MVMRLATLRSAGGPASIELQLARGMNWRSNRQAAAIHAIHALMALGLLIIYRLAGAAPARGGRATPSITGGLRVAAFLRLGCQSQLGDSAMLYYKRAIVDRCG